MSNFFKSIIDFFTGGKNKKITPVASNTEKPTTPTIPSPVAAPVPMPEPEVSQPQIPKDVLPAPEVKPPEPEIQLINGVRVDWLDQAMKICGSFEGQGTDWGNPVGNFDGAGLTCGLLGFTWVHGNQQPMLKEFVGKHGLESLMKHCPTIGRDYWRAANLPIKDGMSVVKKWTSTPSHVVKEAPRKELNSLWSSPEMIEIQRKTSIRMFGLFAQKKCLETALYFQCKERPEFFIYWFDQAVLNGASKTVAFEVANDQKIKMVLNWIRNEDGYNEQDAKVRNVPLWTKVLAKSDIVQKSLFVMAMRRADLSKEEFDLTVMNRRGTLALGIGYVNGSLRKYPWEPK